jgi:DNA-binding NarL/FixJ family response regulator
MEVIGEAGDGASAQRLIRQKQPDVVLLNVDLPDGMALTPNCVQSQVKRNEKAGCSNDRRIAGGRQLNEHNSMKNLTSLLKYCILIMRNLTIERGNRYGHCEF